MSEYPTYILPVIRPPPHSPQKTFEIVKFSLFLFLFSFPFFYSHNKKKHASFYNLSLTPSLSHSMPRPKQAKFCVSCAKQIANPENIKKKGYACDVCRQAGLVFFCG